jgi:hypothetical protein
MSTVRRWEFSGWHGRAAEPFLLEMNNRPRELAVLNERRYTTRSLHRDHGVTKHQAYHFRANVNHGEEKWKDSANPASTEVGYNIDVRFCHKSNYCM